MLREGNHLQAARIGWTLATQTLDASLVDEGKAFFAGSGGQSLTF